MNWPISRLGDLVDIKGGGTPSRANPDYWGGEVPWATVKDFKNGVILGTDEHITRSGLENSSANLIPMGTILIPSRMALGRVAIAGVDMAINQDLKALVIVCSEKLDRGYLFWFLNSVSADFERAGKGATVKGITLDFVKAVQVPLPPLATQRHIAKVLEQADLLCRQSQQMEAELGRLAQALFLEMFGDPLKNEKGWQKKSLSSVSTLSRGRFGARPRNDPQFYGGEYPFIQTGAVVAADTYINCHRQTLNDKGLAVSRVFPEGTIVITIAANIGATAILGYPMCFPDSVVGIAAGSGMIAEFLEYQLRFFKAFLESEATETAQKNINLQVLEPLQVLVPPLDLQEEFSKSFKAVRVQLENIRQSRVETDEMFNALLQRAFKGELTPKVA